MKNFISILFWVSARAAFQRMTKLVVILCGLYILPGCAGGLLGQPEYVTWQEEVKLNDGRVIVVTQKRHCSAAYTGGNYATCIERESWLTIKLPEFGNQIVWHENLKPRILNVHNGQLYIVGSPATCLEYRTYGRPSPMYIGFVLVSGHWERIPFEKIPESIYDTNLVIDGQFVRTDFLTIVGKNSSELNGSSGYSAHEKRIDLEAKSNCF